MLKQLIEYTDFNGVARKENFYFNLTETELLQMELGVTGGMRELLKTIIEKQDIPKLMSAFKEIILKAQGEKSPDGRVFNKSPELSKAFEHTNAYSTLYMSLIKDANTAAKFINDIMPENMRNEQVLTPVASGSTEPASEDAGLLASAT